MSLHGKADARVLRTLQQIRRHALSFPESHEDHPWEHSAFKVKGKTFVFAAADSEGLGISVKLEESHAHALRHPFASPTRYGLGKHGWVSARFEPDQAVPLDLLKRWIEESFFAVAPLSVLKLLEPEGTPSPTAARRSRRRRLDDLDFLAGAWSAREAREFDAALMEQRSIAPAP